MCHNSGGDHHLRCSSMPAMNLRSFAGVFLGGRSSIHGSATCGGLHEGDTLGGALSRCISIHDGTVQTRVTSSLIRWSWVRVPPANAVAQWQSIERIPAR